MEPVVIAVLVGVAVYIGMIALIPGHIIAESTQYTRSMLEKLASTPMDEEGGEENTMSVLRAQSASSPLAKLFFLLPGAKAAYPKLLRAGMANSIGGFFGLCLIILCMSMYVLRNFGAVGIAIACGFTYMFGRWYVRRQISKRNGAFLEYFPDALDMIVRSVRSGYPLNSAVRMVADNMQPPVSTEFKQVADEVSYGSTLIDALQRLSMRIDEPDVRFFVVVLSVQQDVGGNLSEVLNNLAGIIRKRKYLRLKIKALSSEGRATAWVLGSMPVLEALAIQAVSPGHLKPLFDTTLGHTVLGVTVAVVLVGVFIVRQIVNIKV